MNKLLFEKSYPYLFGVIAIILWWEFGCKFPKNTDSLLSAMLTVAGIFVGFLATSKAILLSMTSPIIETLKTSGYRNVLVSYIGSAIWLNLALCTVCVVGFFLTAKPSWYCLLWVGIAVSALMSFVRVTHIMLKIFKQN